jgi:hypothetical protein
MELPQGQQQAYQVEQQVWAHAWQIDVERWAPQRHDELANKQAALDLQMTELHQSKTVQGMKRAATVGYTTARAWVRAIAIAINHNGTPHTTFPRASQNVVAATTLLDTLPAPSTDGARKVYQQLKDILRVATEQ